MRLWRSGVFWEVNRIAFYFHVKDSSAGKSNVVHRVTALFPAELRTQAVDQVAFWKSVLRWSDNDTTNNLVEVIIMHRQKCDINIEPKIELARKDFCECLPHQKKFGTTIWTETGDKISKNFDRSDVNLQEKLGNIDCFLAPAADRPSFTSYFLDWLSAPTEQFNLASARLSKHTNREKYMEITNFRNRSDCRWL